MTTADRKAIPSAAYSNLGARPGERFDHFHAHMAGVCELRSPSEAASAPYDIDSRKWLFDGAMLIAGSYPRIDLIRRREHVQRDQLEHIEIRVRRDSSQALQAGARQVVAAAGQAVLVDCARPSATQWAPGRTVVAYVAREPLDRLLPQPLDLHGLLLQGVAASLLADQLVMLADRLPQMRAEEGPGVRMALLHLLAAGLAPTADAVDRARPAIEDGLLRMARRLIETELRSEALGVDRLCRHFKVSRSSMYRLFEPLGGIAGYIRDRRLARIHESLASGESTWSIERLAWDHGFRNASHFSRAFRDRYGCSPSEARRHAAAGPMRTPDREVREDHDGFLHWARSFSR